LRNSLLHLILKNGDFLNTDILQGSVATRSGRGGVFANDFVTNFLLSLTVKIGQYLVKLGVCFLTHGVHAPKRTCTVSLKHCTYMFRVVYICMFVMCILYILQNINSQKYYCNEQHNYFILK